MAWIYQTVSNIGTSDVNVARLVVQTQTMADFTTLSRVEKDGLFAACYALSHRLANASAAANDVSKRIDAEVERYMAKMPPQPNQPVELPYAQALDITFEGYFYNAKNIVRDLGHVMKVVYGKRFEEASDWCAFGKKTESEVSKFFRRLARENAQFEAVRNIIENSRADIEMLVRIRNAIEHPGRASGTVVLRNFEPGPDGVRKPSFYFAGEEDPEHRYDIGLSLKQFHEMLLDLAEMVIVFGLLGKFAHPNLGVYKIPEAERDPAAPVAFRVINITEHMRANSKPFDGRPVTGGNDKRPGPASAEPGQ